MCTVYKWSWQLLQLEPLGAVYESSNFQESSEVLVSEPTPGEAEGRVQNRLKIASEWLTGHISFSPFLCVAKEKVSG